MCCSALLVRLRLRVRLPGFQELPTQAEIGLEWATRPSSFHLCIHTDGTNPIVFSPSGNAELEITARSAGTYLISDIFLLMARFPRVVAVDVPDHVTQRGNARQVILASEADRLTYMALLREYAQLYRLSLLGYSLMPSWSMA